MTGPTQTTELTEQASIDRRVLAQRDADGWLFLVEAAQTGWASLRTAWQSVVRPGRQPPARVPPARVAAARLPAPGGGAPR